MYLIFLNEAVSKPRLQTRLVSNSFNNLMIKLYTFIGFLLLLSLSDMVLCQLLSLKVSVNFSSVLHYCLLNIKWAW